MGIQVNAVNWTPEDDNKIRDFVLHNGNRWTEIQSCVLEERTVSSIRNRWQRIQKGAQGIGRNKCHKCGQTKRGHSCKGIAHALPRVVTSSRIRAKQDPSEANENVNVCNFKELDVDFYVKKKEASGNVNKSLTHVLYMCSEMGYDLPEDVTTSLKLKGVVSSSKC